MTLYIADTNVVSELMRPAPDSRVTRTLEQIEDDAAHRIAITSITRAELRYGVALLASVRKRELLGAALDAFASWEVLSFDAAAADQYGTIAARRRQAGLAVAVADTMIAAVTWAHRATLLTRNIRDFDEAGVAVVNPWVA